MARPAGPQLLVVLVAALALPLAPLAADIVTAQTEEDDGVPRSYMRGIEVGDHWTYRISGDQRGEIHNEVVAETMKTSAYWQATHPAFEIRAEGHIDSDELGPLGDTRYEVRGTKWVRTSDYATIQVEGQSTVHNIDNSDARESFEAPLVDLVHPFASGYEWVAQARWAYEPEDRDGSGQTLEQSVVQRVRVEGQETITVPAGTFEAWRLNYTSYRPGGGFALRWHVDAVCDFVREDAFDKDRKLTHRLELVDHSCSATEVPQPVYDVGNVTLVSRGVLGGPTGNEVPRPGGDDPTSTENGEAASPWLWPALGVTFGVAAMLVMVGRRRA